MNDLPLWAEIDYSRSRKHDPDTSKAAAERVEAERHCRFILAALRACKPGLTAGEIATIVSAETGEHFDNVRVSRRLSGIRDAGLIVSLDGRKYGAVQMPRVVRDGQSVHMAIEHWKSVAA